MDKRFYGKLAILAKIEETYGTDATPAGATDAMQMKDVTLTPFAGDQVAHDFMLPYLGNQGVELVGNYVQIEGSVEMAGSGTPGTPPAYGPLLRACGFSETIPDPDPTDVQYDPVSDGFEACSIYFNQDKVRHVALGCRGTVVMSLAPKQIPTFKFTLTGLLGTITDQALPEVDLTKFLTAVPVSKAMTTLSLHGHVSAAESLTIDTGVKVDPDFLIGYEEIDISDRQASGTAVVRAERLATIDWFGIARARTRGALTLVHGTTAGNIVAIDAPAVELGRVTQGQTNGKLNYSLPLSLIPADGDDELKITVK